MRRIVVLNAKGGCGKTTLVTNLASCYALRGCKTALIDYDPQSSSLHWLRARPPEAPSIQGVAIHDSTRVPLAGAWQIRVPRETRRVIVDTPAGIRALDLVGRVGPNDTLLIPLQASAVDIRATADFVRDLLLVAKLRPEDKRIAFVVNRVRRNARFMDGLQRFLDSLQIPAVAQVRDSQSYVLAADQGLGVCELPQLQSRRERGAWATLLDWLETGCTDALSADPLQGTSPPPPRPASLPIPRFLARDWDAGDAPAPSAPPSKLN